MQTFLDYLESTICNLEDIASQFPTLDALAILVEQERRGEVIVFLRTMLSLRLPSGKLCLDRINRRILYMYIIGFPQRSIAAKVGIIRSSVQWRINGMAEKILKCQGGHLVNWDLFLEPPQSILEAHAPETMLRWCHESAMKSWSHSYWGKHNNKKEFKVAEKCMMPEWFEGCFGDGETRCTMCNAKCTRKKVNR